MRAGVLASRADGRDGVPVPAMTWRQFARIGKAEACGLQSPRGTTTLAITDQAACSISNCMTAPLRYKNHHTRNPCMTKTAKRFVVCRGLMATPPMPMAAEFPRAGSPQVARHFRLYFAKRHGARAVLQQGAATGAAARLQIRSLTPCPMPM